MTDRDEQLVQRAVEDRINEVRNIGEVIDIQRQLASWEKNGGAEAAERARFEQKRAEDMAKARQRKAVAEAEEQRRKTMVECGFPVHHLDCILDGKPDRFRPNKASFYLDGAARAGQRTVVLLGPKGTGKTMAAVWWLLQERDAPRWVERFADRFVDAPTLARWPRYDDVKMLALERAGALVIDDLGMEYDDTKGAFRSMLDGLVNARYAMSLPTVITTNIPNPADFRARYGERIHDRVIETGGFYGCPGESMRGSR